MNGRVFVRFWVSLSKSTRGLSEFTIYIYSTQEALYCRILQYRSCFIVDKAKSKTLVKTNKILKVETEIPGNVPFDNRHSGLLPKLVLTRLTS